MKILQAIFDLLDCLLYIAAGVGIFIAAFNGSMIWVCVCGFILIDEGITFFYRKITRRNNA